MALNRVTTNLITNRNIVITSGSTITPNVDLVDSYEVSALATNTTIAAPTGTPIANQKLLLKIKDNGISQFTIAWTTTAGGYRGVDVYLPNQTTLGKVLYVGCIYNATDNYWDVLAVSQL